MSNTLQITEQQTTVESIMLTLKTLENDAKSDVKEEQTSNNENDAKSDVKEKQTSNNENNAPNDVKEEQTPINESTQRVENLAITELLNLVHEAAASQNRELMNAVCQKLADLMKDDKDAANELKKIINSLAMEELFDIITKLHKAADNEELLGALCQEVADRIKNKSAEEVREILGIENDFTPEEEAAVRNEHAWAYEDDDAVKDA